MAALEHEEIARRAEGSEWHRDGEAIRRDFKLKNFAEALALVNAIGEAAENADHHPDLSIHGYNNLTVVLSTHSDHGVTDKDFALAAEIDELAGAR